MDVIAIPMDATMKIVLDTTAMDAFRKALNVRRMHAETATEVMADVNPAKRSRHAAAVIMRSKS